MPPFVDMPKVIVPRCVGTYFPSNADALRAQVQDYAAAAARSRQASPPTGRPKAIIVPHAGYDYSGPVAVAAYAGLTSQAETVRRVVLLGTCHTLRTSSLLTTTADAFSTPLGQIVVDKSAVGQAGCLAQVSVDNEAHREDHSLAVQLPLLQLTLEEFQVAPLLVGDCPTAKVAEVIELLWGGDETLIVVSSDLSHYLSYDEACHRDQRTAKAIVHLNAKALGPDDACGYRAIAGLLRVARRHKLTVHAIDVRNSGDIAGTRDRVVGYGAFVFAEE